MPDHTVALSGVELLQLIVVTLEIVHLSLLPVHAALKRRAKDRDALERNLPLGRRAKRRQRSTRSGREARRP